MEEAGRGVPVLGEQCTVPQVADKLNLLLEKHSFITLQVIAYPHDIIFERQLLCGTVARLLLS